MKEIAEARSDGEKGGGRGERFVFEVSKCGVWFLDTAEIVDLDLGRIIVVVHREFGENGVVGNGGFKCVQQSASL